MLSESAADADMPRNPDVLDGVGQLLLLRDLRPDLNLIYHSTVWHLPEFVESINRAKDELVTPDDFDQFVAREQATFEDRYGSYADAAARLLVNGNLKPVRDVRSEYGKLRRNERASKDADADAPMKISPTARPAEPSANSAASSTGAGTPMSSEQPSTSWLTRTSRTARRWR